MKKFLCNRVLFCLLVFLLTTPAFSIPFTDFDFDASEFDKEIELEFENYKIKISDIKRKGDSLSCYAGFYFGSDKNYAELFFPKFTLNRDGSFKSGNTTNKEDDSVYFHEGKDFWLYNAYLEKCEDSYQLICKKAKVGVPWEFGEKYLLTSQIAVDMQGNLLSIKYSAPKTLKLKADNKFETYVNLNSIICDENNVIRANGEISVPNLKLYITANNHEISYSNFTFFVNPPEAFTFEYGVDLFTSKSISMESRHKTKYLFDDVIVTHDNKQYPLGKVEYWSVGSTYDSSYPMELDSEWNEGQIEGYSFLLPDDQIQKYCYSDGGLTVILLSRFPAGKDYNFRVGATIKPDKIVYYVPNREEEKGLWFGDFYVKADNSPWGLKESYLRYDGEAEEFTMASGKVISPENCAIGNFVVNYAKTEINGHFYLNGELPGTIDFCNNAFEPDKIKFTDDGILLTGRLYLNTGISVYVKELLIGYDGTVKSFETRHFGYDENVIAQEFYVTSQSSYLMVEQEQYSDVTLSKPILWQVFEDSEISTDRMPRPVPIKDLRQNHSETRLRFFSKEYPFEQYYERLEREGGR